MKTSGKDSSRPLGMTMRVISNEGERSVSRLFEGDHESTKLKNTKLSPTFLLPRDAGEERGGGFVSFVSAIRFEADPPFGGSFVVSPSFSLVAA